MERRKAFKKVQGMSMVDPSIFDTAAYCIIEGNWLKETSVSPDVVTFLTLEYSDVQSREISEMLRWKTIMNMQNF